MATHNHFVLDRGGKVFKQTAPMIKLAEASSEEDHLRLLGVLNSSVACFWLKQVCHNKGAGGGTRVEAGYAALGAEEWENHYAFNAKSVRELPLPAVRSSELSRALDCAALERASMLSDLGAAGDTSLGGILESYKRRDLALAQQIISLQEELDWQTLGAYGLVSDDSPVLGESAPPIQLGERAFEFVLARQVAARETDTTWFERHGSTPRTEIPADWPEGYRELVKRRIALIESDPNVGLIERPEHKRRWNGRAWGARVHQALTTLALDALEAPDLWEDLRLRSTAELTDHLRKTPLLVEAMGIVAGDRDADLGKTVERLVTEAAVPHLAAQRLKETGLRKRAVWEQVWEMQRAADRGEDPGRIPVPPKYAQPDFTSATSWKHRGKLDVPKERFVLIPNAQRGADASPVVGWAGWDELALARAVAGRITELRNEEAAGADRVTSLLTGVLELLPWIHQWHPESNPVFGGPPGTFLESWLDGQLSELAVTRETLRAWRPPAPTRGRRRATA